MQRRSFIKQSVLWTAGCAVGSRMSLWGAVSAADEVKGTVLRSGELYKLFRDPQSIYRPFVRWWWNGDKVEADELKRELHILKEAGIGGVEINPVKFPGNDTDDLGKKSLPWLSDEWIDMLKVAFDEAKSLDMTCDLIVGSGWPFGAEFLTGDERADVVVNYSEVRSTMKSLATVCSVRPILLSVLLFLERRWSWFPCSWFLSRLAVLIRLSI